VEVLQLQNISKSYGKIRALQELSFDVPQGAIFGVLGPNGSGKTTLLSIILDVLKPDQGDFRWFGEPGSPAIRRKIGSLLETPNFYHYLSAVNNLKITRSISGTEADINAVLEKVKLFERRNSRFQTFSLGMKQRLAIGAALLGNPGVLVLDEPTNGLDPVGIAEIRDLMKELNRQGHTIIMASHLLDEVEKVCTHVAILKTGQLITSGTVTEVMADEDLVEMGAADLQKLMDILQGYPGSISLNRSDDYIQLLFPRAAARPAEINQFCQQRGISLNHLLIKKKRLETKFFELTNN
jgi:ABC-2 type transport system ATP-binding protein